MAVRGLQRVEGPGKEIIVGAVLLERCDEVVRVSDGSLVRELEGLMCASRAHGRARPGRDPGSEGLIVVRPLNALVLRRPRPDAGLNSATAARGQQRKGRNRG